MRLVHLADLHIGYRQFDRVGPRGVNQRELDVERTFATVIDRVIAIAPDLIVIGGDVFHSPKPTPNAIVAAFSGFSRLTQALPNTIVVIAAGNHDVSRAAENTSILQLFVTLGIHVVDAAAQRLYFPDRDLSVLALPDIPNLTRPPLEPDPRARWNVAVIHGEMHGQLPAAVSAERAAIEITPGELNAAAWDYVALGHWHVYQEIAPNCFYSGSIDYTSSNVWGELAAEVKTGVPGKGIVERDLVTGAQTFHAHATARPFLDLPKLDISGFTIEEANAAITAAVDACPGGIKGKVVRLVVVGATHATRKDLDHRAIRAWRAQATAFHLVVDVVPVVSPLAMALHDSRLSGETLEQVLGRKLASYELTPGVDRGEFTALADHYMAIATEKSGERLTNEPVPLIPDAAPQRRAS